MTTRRLLTGAFAITITLAASRHAKVFAAKTDFPSAVLATGPIAYFALDTTSGQSKVGTSVYSPKGGVKASSPGAGIASTGLKDSYLNFDGKSGWLLTTQRGGVGESASIMAWVNLASMPSKDQRFLYIAGESEYANDLDIQFETDDRLKFYTAAGGHVEFTPARESLLNQWHMIVVTLDTATRTRAIYWDGTLVAHDQGGGKAGKTAPLSIGASTVFSGRWFDGGIEHVALWDRALTGIDVSALYSASGVSTTHQ